MSLADLSHPVVSPVRSRASENAATASGLPTQDELPYSDGEPLESERHVLGMVLLIASLKPWLQRRYEHTGHGGYVAGDMFLYFSPEQVRNRHFRGPDVLIALDVEPGERKSWVVWHEGKAPDVVIELLSNSTRKTDKDSKPTIYRDEVGVREYYWFDPFNLNDFAGYTFSGARPNDDRKIIPPNRYPDGDGRITSDVLGLRLGPWQGRYCGVDAVWLRWYTLDGELLLTEEAEQARLEAQRANKMAEKLRELGLDPGQIL